MLSRTYTWRRQSGVSVAPARELAVGERYGIRNIQQLFGAPVAIGPY